jgi:hypothetical protein
LADLCALALSLSIKGKFMTVIKCNDGMEKPQKTPLWQAGIPL